MADQLDLGFFTESPTSPMQSGNDGQPWKMCQDSSVAPPGETLLQWLESWLGAKSAFLETGGETAVSHLDPEDSLNGEFWTRNTSEFRSGAVVSSLSEILETGEIDPRYYLSAKACRGILRRAEKRGKDLPTMLRRALEQVAEGSSEQAKPEGKTP